jgi:hypothetical protein
MPILNLTLNELTDKQKRLGFIELNEDDKAEIKRLLTFFEIPSPDESWARALNLASIAQFCTIDFKLKGYVLIDCESHFMQDLANAIQDLNMIPVRVLEDTEGTYWIGYKF